MGRLSGKVAVVTGAGSGIGYATGRLMALEGAKIVAADINLEGAQGLVAEIQNIGGDAIAIRTDVTQEDSVQEMIQKAKEAYGKIDILHNNAGGTKQTDKDVAGMDLETWQYALELNLKGVMLGCKHAIPAMVENGGGAIINTASLAGVLGDFSPSAYGAAKGGVISLTRYVATQYGRQNIRCNAITPGLIITPAAEAHLPKEIQNLFESHVSLPRNGRPEDVANVAVFLASDESYFITGQTISVDGGYSSHSSVYADFLRMSSSF